jgi:hypothetical protein
MFGWPINFISPQLPTSTLQNHASANVKHIHNYVYQELQHQAIIGPFLSNPFAFDCVLSPLQCVPKRNSNEPRVVHDLSFPEHSSVNNGITKDTFLGEPFKLILPRY